MGSFTATAEPKAACKVKETNNCKERKDCTMLGLRAVALLAFLATTQCSADSPLSQISNPAPAQSAYLTEMMVQSSSLEPAKCSQNVLEARRTATVTQGVKPTVSLQAALLIFLGVGIFAVFIAQAFQMVRKYVYRDADNLDTAFDAGGKVSIGLTATTIVSQWTWSATLLQSSTVASKVNILENNERLFWNIELRNRSWRPEAVGWLVGGWQPDHKKLPAIDFQRVLAFLIPSTFLERVQEAFCVAY